MLHPHTFKNKRSRRESARAVIDSLFLTVCALLSLLIGALTFALPRADFSQEENRALAPLPSFSVSSFTNGSFFTALSSFCSDHIPLRSEMIRAKAKAELALGKTENNSVLFCDDGRLIARCDYSDVSLLKENLSALDGFCQATGAKCAIVPRSIDVCSSSLPTSMDSAERCWALARGHGGLRQELTALAKDGQELYYLTDHHLNSDGAYAVYEYLSKRLEFEPFPRNELSRQIFCDDFYGSTFSRGGLVADKADAITLYRYEGDEDYVVSCDDAGCDVGALYDFSAASKKDKYLVFQGGNHGVLCISSSGDKPSLLVIKDSFANAVLPLLAIHFDLTVIDPRYTSTTVSTSSFDHTVVLCGIDTLATSGQYKILFLKQQGVLS